jgi:hypothetical protein
MLQPDLFSLPSIGGDSHPAGRTALGDAGGRERPDVPRGMVHRDGLPTEREAAAKVARKLGELHHAVLEELRARGPMTDRELECLARFDALGPSTVRKRRSELFQVGRLEAFGKRDGLTVWRIASTSRQPEEPHP